MQTTKAVTLSELIPSNGVSGKLLERDFSIIGGVKVTIEVVVGKTELTVDELFALQTGSTLALDQLHNAPLLVRLDNKAIAKGTLVVVGENFGVRIDEIHPEVAT